MRIEGKWREPEFKKTTTSIWRMPTTQTALGKLIEVTLLIAGLRMIRKAESERVGIYDTISQCYNPVKNNETLTNVRSSRRQEDTRSRRRKLFLGRGWGERGSLY